MEGYLKLDFERGDLWYALRHHDPESNVHSVSRSPHDTKQEALRSLRLQRVMQEVSVETGREPKDVEKEVQELLEEIGHKMWLPSVRTLALVLRTALRRVLRGIYVNKEGVEQLRAAVHRWPVILLPSHRSYLDFILVTYLMFECNITLPSVAAGQDFMNMALVSRLLRGSGGFFLRRTFGSDKLYKAVFTAYVQTLLCSWDAPIEFFIEGTRSRTAKTLHPRLGLMSMVVEPYLDARVPDVLMVPIGISYERTLEEELFARELLGVPKPKESTKGLFKATAILSEDYGSIVVNIGAPISLHELCQSKGISRVPRRIYPRDTSVVTSGERELIKELGHMILNHMNQCMCIYPSAMIAATVLQHTEGISVDELASTLTWLRWEIEDRGAMVHWEGDDAHCIIQASVPMMASFLELTATNLVKPRTQHLPSLTHHTDSIAELIKMKMDPTELNLVTEISFSHLLLAYYRNQLLHLFVPEAMAALSLHSFIPCDTGPALRRFEALHCALAKEFVLPLKTSAQLFDESLYSLLDRGVVLSHRQGEVSPNPHEDDALVFLKNLILPFVAGVWVLCQHLLSLKGGVQLLRATMQAAQVLAAKCVRNGLLDSYETLSLDMIKNGLGSLTQAGLIQQPTNEVEGRDRLVMVDDQQGLLQLTEELGALVLKRQHRAKL